mmetsp:Transcript_68986/g.224894  ORF Transcript_68986/g.224894 Transcript_68986/m.224894 type:complete len:266 (-) Transcript_68986:2492-3289(-)
MPKALPELDEEAPAPAAAPLPTATPPAAAAEAAARGSSSLSPPRRCGFPAKGWKVCGEEAWGWPNEPSNAWAAAAATDAPAGGAGLYSEINGSRCRAPRRAGSLAALGVASLAAALAEEASRPPPPPPPEKRPRSMDCKSSSTTQGSASASPSSKAIELAPEAAPVVASSAPSKKPFFKASSQKEAASESSSIEKTFSQTKCRSWVSEPSTKPCKNCGAEVLEPPRPCRARSKSSWAKWQTKVLVSAAPATELSGPAKQQPPLPA